MVSPMVASDEPSARLMLFCRSFLRAAAIAATLSGSRISSATRIPAKAGGQGIIGHDQRDGREHDQHTEIEVGSGDLNILLAIAQTAGQNANADQPVADDHHD